VERVALEERAAQEEHHDPHPLPPTHTVPRSALPCPAPPRVFGPALQRWFEARPASHFCAVPR